MKSKLENYALSVCFAAVVCLVVSLSGGIYATFKILMPEITMNSYDYNRFQTNESYWRNGYSRSSEKQLKPSEQVLTEKRTAEFAIRLYAESREGWQTFLKCLIYFIVSGIVLFVHGKIAKTSRLSD